MEILTAPISDVDTRKDSLGETYLEKIGKNMCFF